MSATEKMTSKFFEKARTDFADFQWREFVCGWSAAVINITFTFPVYKMIFRQMLDGIPASIALQQLQNEGIYYLYRGMLPPLAQKSISLSIMFGVYEGVKRPLLAKDTNLYLSKSIAGMVAGSLEAVLMPFERIQTLLADSNYHKQFRNTYHAFRTVQLQYGFKEYYRGAVPILLRNGPSNVLFFIIRDEVQQRLPSSNTWMHTNINQFITGAVIGAFLSSVFYPLNVVKVAMQSQLGGSRQNILVAFKQIYRERGGKIRYIYRGVQANCLRAFLSWGVITAAYDSMKKLLY